MSSWIEELPQVLIEKRRWIVLRHLEASEPTRSLSFQILSQGCRAAGVRTSMDQIEHTVAWLQEAGLVSIERLGPMIAATLTKDGREVAQGHTMVPGILTFDLEI